MKLRKILDWSLYPRPGSVLRPGFVKFCSVVFVLPCGQTKQQRDAVGGKKKLLVELISKQAVDSL